jgi:RNA polymerase sigma-70 factor (ECF subfamily)
VTTVDPTTSEVVPPPAEQPWWTDLTDDGPAGSAALGRLRDLLLRATRHQVWRLRGLLPGAGAVDLDDLAQQAADDALM